MSKVDSTKPSYDALNTVFNDIRAFVDLVDLIPEEDDGATLLRILSDRLESDFLMLREEVYGLWNFIPESDSK